MQTTDEVLDSQDLEDWDRISIRDIPLFTKTLDDATDWVIHLINEETPGYTTTEDTNRKLGDILERPFMCLDSDKVRARVEKSLENYFQVAQTRDFPSCYMRETILLLSCFSA